MNSFLQGIIKTGVAIGLIALAFWPNGVGTYIFKNFEDFPTLYSVIIAIWVGALALNLPLSRTQFTKVSTVSIAVVFAAIMFKLWQTGYFDIRNWEQWAITLIIFTGLTAGWWTSAPRVWKWYRNILAVDDPDTGDDDFS